jgi:glycerophosphoryl diester phosphodiesterase
MPDRQNLIAHRGYRHRYPENSLKAVEAAIDCGAENIEVDIQFSRNLVPFLCHDASLERISGVNRIIMDCHSEELANYTAGEPGRFGDRFNDNPINTLAELEPVIVSNRHITFFVEMKTESSERFGMEHCLKTMADTLDGALGQCVLISYDSAAVAAAKEYGFSKTGIIARRWRNRDALIRRCRADYLFIDYRRIPKNRDIAAGCPVALYEITEPATADLLLKRGAALIETFRIAEMLASHTTGLSL